jgi:hypothetical protein
MCNGYPIAGQELVQEAILMIGGGPYGFRPRDETTRAYLAGRRLAGEPRLTRRKQLIVLSGTLAFFVVILILFFAVG